MKHPKKFKEQVLLYFYDELSEEAARSFREHLKECLICQKEFEKMSALREKMVSLPKVVPTEALVQRANQKVISAIHQSRRHPYIEKLRQLGADIQEALASIMVQPKYQLVSLGVTLIIGIFIGKLWLSSGLRHDPDLLANFVNYQATLTETEKNNLQRALANYLLQSGGIEVENLLQTDRDNGEDGIVEVNLRINRDLSLRGGLDDPTIQNMLRYSAIHEKDPARRRHALRLLAKTPRNIETETTLISILLHDAEEELRLQALETLREYPLSDRMLDTYKTVALGETQDNIRIIALRALYNSGKQSVIPIIALVAANDASVAIRNEAQDLLEQMKNKISKFDK